MIWPSEEFYKQRGYTIQSEGHWQWMEKPLATNADGDSISVSHEKDGGINIPLSPDLSVSWYDCEGDLTSIQISSQNPKHAEKMLSAVLAALEQTAKEFVV